MSAYIVSWGVINKDRYIEADSIVHDCLEDAREEFDLVDLKEAVKGQMARAAFQNGWPSYCRLEKVEMLDGKENPTNRIQDWVYDGSKSLLDEKVSA